jgi:hypothetical protein
VDIVPRVVDDRIVFDIAATGIRGIVRFRVEDLSGNAIWDVRLPGKTPKAIEFGVLPGDTEVEPHQTFPPDGKAPGEIRGMEVKVSVEYKYDAFAPSVGGFEKVVQIPRRE